MCQDSWQVIIKSTQHSEICILILKAQLTIVIFFTLWLYKLLIFLYELTSWLTLQVQLLLTFQYILSCVRAHRGKPQRSIFYRIFTFDLVMSEIRVRLVHDFKSVIESIHLQRYILNGNMEILSVSVGG